MLRTPQLKPFIIYIKPPKFEVLKETRNKARARSTFDENNSRGFTVIFYLKFCLSILTLESNFAVSRKNTNITFIDH